jgi:hypothetical protein
LKDLEYEKLLLGNTLARFVKNCEKELADQNQILLTISRQASNQLCKGVLSAASAAADLTPGSGDYRGLACAYC